MQRVHSSIACTLVLLFAHRAGAQVHPDCNPGETLAACRQRVCTDPNMRDACRRVTDEAQRREQARQRREYEDRDDDDDDDTRNRRNQDDDERDRRDQDDDERDRRGQDDDERDRRGQDDDERAGRSYDDDDAGDIPEVLRPGTRPMFFIGAIGPTFFGLNRDRAFDDRGRGRFEMEFGYHFSGDLEGPAIGANIGQTFDDDFYVFNPTFKFSWDIQPKDDLGLYVTPFAKAGYAGAFCDDGPADFCPSHAFNLGFGAEVRLVLDDRGLVLFRPLQFDNYIGDIFNDTLWLNYSALIGGGVIF